MVCIPLILEVFLFAMKQLSYNVVLSVTEFGLTCTPSCSRFLKSKYRKTMYKLVQLIQNPHRYTRSRGYKYFFMLSSAETEIYSACNAPVICISGPLRAGDSRDIAGLKCRDLTSGECRGCAGVLIFRQYCILVSTTLSNMNI